MQRWSQGQWVTASIATSAGVGFAAIVPLKSTSRGKSRLRLPAERRAALALAMARDTVAAIGALALSSAAYQAEILRGALNAVPRGQGEAATALGFSGLDIWRRILLPQALRISTPPLINEFILLIKASSLVSVVGIAELTRVSMNIATQTYRPLEAYVGGGLFYLAINLCLAGLGAVAERRLAGAGAR